METEWTMIVVLKQSDIGKDWTERNKIKNDITKIPL